MDSPSKRRPSRAVPGYLSSCPPPSLFWVSIPSLRCGSAILSFLKCYKYLVSTGAKTQTRRLWSEATPKKADFFNRMRVAVRDQLFVRVMCANGFIGWAILHSMKQEELGGISEADIAAEGFPGANRADFLAKHFRRVPVRTQVWVVRFTFLPFIDTTTTTN